jgi:ABC-type multidrug transport system fused ATPase/permease subunit
MAKKGETVAIIGESGSGKHLLFNLIMRIYERDLTIADDKDYEIDENEVRPSIKVLGFNMRDVNCRDIREKISYLGKDSKTVTGSIRENMDPNLKYSDRQIIQLLKIFRAEEVIENVSKGDMESEQQLQLTSNLHMMNGDLELVDQVKKFSNVSGGNVRNIPKNTSLRHIQGENESQLHSRNMFEEFENNQKGREIGEQTTQSSKDKRSKNAPDWVSDLVLTLI